MVEIPSRLSCDNIEFLSESTLRVWLKLLTKVIFVLETDFDVEKHGEDVRPKGGGDKPADRKEDIEKANEVKVHIAHALRVRSAGIPAFIIEQFEEVLCTACWDAEQLATNWADCPSQRPIPEERAERLQKVFKFFAHQVGLVGWAHQQHKENILRITKMDLRYGRGELELSEDEENSYEEGSD